jgi:hypothetical protein
MSVPYHKYVRFFRGKVRPEKVDRRGLECRQHLSGTNGSNPPPSTGESATNRSGVGLRWTITPSGTRGVRNDDLSIYFREAKLASAFVTRWCLGAKVETTGGVFQVREDEPAPRVGAWLHRTP